MTDDMSRDPFTPLDDAAAPNGGASAEEWTPILPAPHALPERIRHSRHGEPSRVWRYLDAAGALLFAVARFDDGKGGKEVLPYTCGTNGWRWKAPPEPRPLYGLRDLAARPDAPALVVEGEKTAAAAAAIFPEYAVVTWQGGTNATGKADWTVLAGRRVAVWPDHDEAGRKAAGEVARACRASGAASVAVVAIPAGWPAKWDVADALPPGADAETLRAMVAEADRKARDAATLPAGFRLTGEGLFHAASGDDDTPLHVCGPLRVVAATHDGTGQNWGALLNWSDPDGRRHEWAMPRAMLAGDGTDLRARLMDAGLFIAPSRKARERLAEYLTRAAPPERVRVVSRIGWHGPPGARVFVLPDGALGGAEAGRVMLQTERPDAAPPLVSEGTLADWQEAVAALAVGNSRLAFALSVAFAAPLVALVNAEAGGFHLRGGSSLGKTTALQAAGSVWGGGGLRGWCRSWRSTDNALEAVAAAHCDLLLCLDEMGEAAPDTVGASAYMLANGAGKGRAGRDGGPRRIAAWRVLFLSSGETGLAATLAEARGGPRQVRAGQEVRVLDLPAEAGPLGLFETLHGHATGGALADAVKAGAAHCYGQAGRTWLERLAAEPDGFAVLAREAMGGFLSDHVPKGATGQVRRAAGRFALVAAAGELAAACGILPWQPGEAERAAAACFAAWRGARPGGDAAGEDAAALAAVRAFLGAHGESRFQTVGAQDEAEARLVINRAGWRKRDGDGWRFFFLPETWKREVMAGVDPEAAARALRRAGHLVPQSNTEKRHTRMERVGLAKPMRLYVIRDTILSDAED